MDKKGFMSAVMLGLFFVFLSLTPDARAYNNVCNNLTEDRVREIVIDVIKKNPKLIYHVLNDYLNKEREKKELSYAFKHRISGIPIRAYNPSKGPKDAPILIIEFTDFQCPFCKRASYTMDRLIKLYPNKIRLVFRNLPLSSIHKEALHAAKAAMAANKQDKFWPYYDLLFETSPNLNKNSYIRIAKTLGLDIDRFKKDMVSKQVDEEIKTDVNTAKKFGINVTPVFVINGVLIKGARPLAFFKKVIEILLKENQKQIGYQ